MPQPAQQRRPAETESRVGLAALAFVFHAPGVVVLARRRLTLRARRVNLLALALTLLAMIAAYLLAVDGGAGRAVLVTWLIGHFAWSVVFSSWIALGGALR